MIRGLTVEEQMKKQLKVMTNRLKKLLPLSL
jgi:hypothetical protein